MMFPRFIVDNYSNTKRTDKITSYQTYSTNSQRKCDELVFLLNELSEQNEELDLISMEKQKHIVHLENKIHRMRENIKRLEVLYHYRGQFGSVDLKKECWELKQENGRLKGNNKQLADLMASEIEKNAELMQENNSLKIENKRLKELIK